MTSSKRASAELVLNAISETKQRTSQLKISKSVIALLQKVAEQEEKELFLYSIREELMDRVMEEIYKRYLERQSIKFTVDCAYKALVQVLKTNFFVHDKVTVKCKLVGRTLLKGVFVTGLSILYVTSSVDSK